MIRLFIGYDKVESVAFHTLLQSVIERTKVPVAFTVVKQSMLPMYNRERDPRQSNEFSFTRFLVPHLCNYDGWGIFMDCDMMLRTDLDKLWELRDPSKAVMVVKHDYTPVSDTKYLGAKQYKYPRKNWSSVMMFNCSHLDCQDLTPDYVNTAPPLDLHRFEWTTDDCIGGLPVEWNHLVGEYPENPDAMNVHWTIGGPYFNEYADAEFADEWFEMRDHMMNCVQIERRDAG